MSLLSWLMNTSAKVIVSPRVCPSRSKAYGRMWDGMARFELNGVILHYELWYHGEENETLESLLPHFSLKYLEVNGKGIDTYWHCLITDYNIFYHERGWFGFDPLDKKLMDNPLVQRRGNPNFDTPVYSEEEIKELLALGFVKLL